MLVERFVVGALEVNCWVVADEASREAMVVDPGDEPDRIEDWLKEQKLKARYLVCTHSHFDHVGGLPELKEATKADILLHKAELPIYERAAEMARLWGFQLEKLPKPDRFVAEGDEITVGSLRFKVWHTPGHSPGGICLVTPEAVFTGDSLFAGSVGRTDLPGGDYEALMKSLQRLSARPDDTVVYAGHGPASRVSREKASNPFLTGEFQ